MIKACKSQIELNEQALVEVATLQALALRRYSHASPLTLLLSVEIGDVCNCSTGHEAAK